MWRNSSTQKVENLINRIMNSIVLELEFLIYTVNNISILQHVEVRGCRNAERFDDRGCIARGRQR